MYLTDFILKNVYVGKTLRGVCRGVGISPKSFSVKYLLCASAKAGENTAGVFSSNDDHCHSQRYLFPQNKETDFSVNISAVENWEEEILLTRLRPVFPKGCWKLFLGIPIFSLEGVYLGRLANAEIYNECIVRLIGDNGATFSPTLIAACSDVLILRKEQPYPLGQRIPAPAVSHILDKKEGLVSKAVLRSALQKSALIRFTLSLPPFSMEYPQGKGEFKRK